jgi:uncharacterized membrane protein (UPF0127 family)
VVPVAIPRTALLTLVCAGCTTVHGDCEDDPRARDPLPRIEVMLAGEVFEAEVADTPSALERPWAFRRCDLEAMVLVPPSPGGAYPVALCDVQTEVDLAFVRQGTIVEAVRFAPPCQAECGQCPVYGSSVSEVDHVVMLVAGQVDFFNGQPVFGLDQLQ